MIDKNANATGATNGAEELDLAEGRYYLRDGSGALYRFQTSGLSKWYGGQWINAGDRAYRDFEAGALPFEEITASFAAVLIRVGFGWEAGYRAATDFLRTIGDPPSRSEVIVFDSIRQRFLRPNESPEEEHERKMLEFASGEVYGPEDDSVAFALEFLLKQGELSEAQAAALTQSEP